MSRLIITGKNRLNGELTIQGSKSSCLPILAVCLLINDKVVLKNCPDISDVREMISVLSYLGCEVDFYQGELTLNCENAKKLSLPNECSLLRASITFVGAMLSRFESVKMPYPGGCNLGGRPINFHIDGLRALGVEILEENDYISARVVKNRLNGYYSFPKPSLGALENLIIRALSINGTCIFDNCTLEPEIVDFCDFLNKAGASIHGAGTKRIVVEGGRILKGIVYEIPGDRIVAGTYLCAVAVTGGNVRLKGVFPDRLYKMISYLRKIGCHLFTDYQTNEIIEVANGELKGEEVIITGPYPEFSTDLQPQMMATSCFVQGNTMVKDLIYPARYGIVKELKKMGADISELSDIVIIKGGNSISGADLVAMDLRGGAALVIAALGSEGISEITGCEYITRGYEDIQRDLRALGADIKWSVEDEENQLTKQE